MSSTRFWNYLAVSSSDIFFCSFSSPLTQYMYVKLDCLMVSSNYFSIIFFLFILNNFFWLSVLSPFWFVKPIQWFFFFFNFREWIFQFWNFYLALYIFNFLLKFPICWFITSIYIFLYHLKHTYSSCFEIFVC